MSKRLFSFRKRGRATTPNLLRSNPERAYEWELRLQYEIEPDFTIDEEGSDAYRVQLLEEHPKKMQGIRDAENEAAQEGRRRKQAREICCDEFTGGEE